MEGGGEGGPPIEDGGVPMVVTWCGAGIGGCINMSLSSSGIIVVSVVILKN